MRSVTDETFDAEVLRAQKPVIVDFWAPWCGPCKAIEPALEELAAGTDRVELVRVDIDANPRTADRCGVLSIPTVTLFAGGEARASVYGARPKRHFEKTFSAYL
jgi:thioredoxin 1